MINGKLCMVINLKRSIHHTIEVVIWNLCGESEKNRNKTSG